MNVKNNNKGLNFIFSLFIMKGVNKKGFMYKDFKGFFLGELGMISQCILETIIHEIAKLDYQPWIIKDIRLKDKITMFLSYRPSGRNCFR